MAPILSFTAEEAFAIFEPGKSVSIFTEEFFNLPEIAGAEELLAKWERIRKVRTDVQKESKTCAPKARWVQAFKLKWTSLLMAMTMKPWQAWATNCALS